MVNKQKEFHEPIEHEFISYDVESLSISVSNSILTILENSFTFASLE